MPRTFRFLLRLCVLGGLCWAMVCPAAQLVIVGEPGQSFLEAEQALTEELVRSGLLRSEIARMDVSEVAAWDGGDASVRMVVTLGVDALRAVLAKDAKLPTLATLVPKSAVDRVLKESGHRTNGALSAVYLDQPLARQFDVVRLVLPQAGHVGVLLGPESSPLQGALESLGQARRTQVVVGQVTAPNTVFPSLKLVLEASDALLAVADPNVFNSFSISNILLTTYRARVPVFAFSPAYVKAGAMVALYSTPTQLGLQAAQMVRIGLQTGVLPPPQYPVDYAIAVNGHVANSLGLSLDATLLLERLRRLEKRP